MRQVESTKERLGCSVALLGAAFVLVLFVLAVARSVKPDGTSPAASPSASTSASAEPVEEFPGTRTLLDGIGVGDSVAGWRIDRTRLVKGKRLAIEVRHGKTGFTIWIVRKGIDKRTAPRQTDRYDLYFGQRVNYGGPVPPGAEAKVLDAIAARLKRTGDKVPVPAGM